MRTHACLRSRSKREIPRPPPSRPTHRRAGAPSVFLSRACRRASARRAGGRVIAADVAEAPAKAAETAPAAAGAAAAPAAAAAPFVDLPNSNIRKARRPPPSLLLHHQLHHRRASACVAAPPHVPALRACDGLVARTAALPGVRMLCR